MYIFKTLITKTTHKLTWKWSEAPGIEVFDVITGRWYCALDPAHPARLKAEEKRHLIGTAILDPLTYFHINEPNA